jgi:hypothetical protein
MESKRGMVMRTIFSGYLVVGLLVLSLSVAHSQQQKDATMIQQMDQEQAMKIGQQALVTYVNNVLTERNYAAFGFKNLKEAQAAMVCTPYHVMVIEHKTLKEYKPKSAVKPLLKDPGILWFPVLADGITRTKVELVRVDNRWVSGELGGTTGPIEIMNVRSKLPELLKSQGISESHEALLVRIPILLASFVYISAPQGEFLIPAMARPERFRLENGVVYIADQVLTDLKVIAAKIKEGTLH